MRKKLNWEACSLENRIKSIERLKQIINTYGYIANFNMFSDLALGLSIEIEENKIIDLHNDLQKIVTLSDFDSKKIDVHSNKEWIIFMNISFSEGTGNLKHEKPMVDG